MTTLPVNKTSVHIILDQGKQGAAIRRDLKEAVLPTPEARTLDLTVLNGRALDVKDLEAALKTCPAIGPRRLVVIEEGHRMNDACWTLISRWAELEDPSCIVVVDMKNTRGVDRILRALKGRVSVVTGAKEGAGSPFDLTRMMQTGRKEQALRLLHRLLTENQAPLQILGLLGWFWGKTSARWDSNIRTRGWRVLLTADEAIKRSRMAPAAALEYAILSLMECMTSYKAKRDVSTGRRLRG